MDAQDVVFLDTETTGLDPDRHEIWDLAFIRDDIEYEFRLDVDLAKADPIALKISHFYERLTDDVPEDPIHLAARVAALLWKRHIVGAVPSFDDAFLKRFFAANGQAPTWHYHLVDVEALVAGRLGITPPWNSEELSRAIGVEPADENERHTAIGDARWVKAMYEAVYDPNAVDGEYSRELAHVGRSVSEAARKWGTDNGEE